MTGPTVPRNEYLRVTGGDCQGYTTATVQYLWHHTQTDQAVLETCVRIGHGSLTGKIADDGLGPANMVRARADGDLSGTHFAMRRIFLRRAMPCAEPAPSSCLPSR